ncbi:MAG: hypothetical protein Q9195_001531 [Heterodermia aff. obscurata]
MAEDGMLVNFSLSDEIIRSKPVFKGGRWRDRLSAKRSIRPRVPKPTPTENESAPATSHHTEHVVEGTTSPVTRPFKRQKLEPRSGTTPKNRNSNAEKEIISSLFTYNPPAQAPAETVQEDEQIAEPSNAPLPDGIETFTSLGLSTILSSHLLTKLSLKSPTAIQASSIRQLLSEDADAFIQAETGSGKTLAYLLPIVQRIMAISTRRENGAPKLDRKAGLFAIILSPTRELASQISHVLSLILARTPFIVASTVIGGEKLKSEKSRLRKGLNILVATPGRLVDHLDNTEVLDVSQVRWLVLDEGDRLMELGFEKAIQAIVERLEKGKKFAMEQAEGIAEGLTKFLPKRRVTILCSATMKLTVQRLGEISLKDAVYLKAEPKPLSQTSGNTGSETFAEVDSGDKAFQAPSQLKQSYIIVPPKQRLVSLAALLKHTFARRGSVMKAIVFLSCADSVDFHFEVFARDVDGASTEDARKSSPASKANTMSICPSLTSKINPSLTIYRLHGSLPHPVRKSTLQAFSQSADPAILLCTDVASRGLDLPNIDLVIEYDPPFSTDDHVHRVGRTARAGKSGRAECFLMPGAEEGYVEVLKEGVAGGKLTRHDAEAILRKGFAIDNGAKSQKAENNAKDGAEERPKDWEEAATEYQLDIERWVIGDGRAGDMARKAYLSHVRAYATHVSHEREMFDVKSLHLGHLAKAFALRERPGKMGRGGVAKSNNNTLGRKQDHEEGKRKVGKSASKQAIDVLATEAASTQNPSRREVNADVMVSDGRNAARRMRAKMNEHMAGASEFNIG